jgi:hypothetical protein
MNGSLKLYRNNYLRKVESMLIKLKIIGKFEEQHLLNAKSKDI